MKKLFLMLILTMSLCACDLTPKEVDYSEHVKIILDSSYNKYEIEELKAYLDGEALNKVLAGYMPYVGFDDVNLYLPYEDVTTPPNIEVTSITQDKGMNYTAEVSFGESVYQVQFQVENGKIIQYTHKAIG